MKKLFKKIEVRHLVVFYLLMFTMDKIHCDYLASQYNCAVSELYSVVGFYWLSPVFGIIDLILGIMILLKSHYNLANEVKIIIVELPIMNSTLQAGVNLSWLKRKLSRLFGGFIIFISVASLILDVMLFLQK